MSLRSYFRPGWWVAFLAILLLAVFVFLAERSICLHTGGRYTLPSDQAFATCAVAKTLAFHQVWGLSKWGFQPVASSLLYPVVLAPFFFVGGASVGIVVGVNLMIAVCFLLLVAGWMRRLGVSAWGRLGWLVAFVAFLPMALLIVSGTEYMLELLFSFLFLRAVVEKRNLALLLITAFFLVATRYDGFYLVVLGCGVLAARRDWKSAGIMLAVGLAPVLLFGWLCHSKGFGFVPAVMVGGSGQVYWSAQAAVLLLVGFVFFSRGKKIVPAVLVGLVLLGVNVFLVKDVVKDSVELFDRQYSAAGFIHLYYYKRPIASDSIGMLSFFSEGRKLDATKPNVRPWRFSYGRNGRALVTTDSIVRSFGLADVILLRDSGAAEGWMNRWNKVAVWKDAFSRDPRPLFSFYVRDTFTATHIRSDLKAYEWRLPPGLKAEYY